MTGFMEFLTLYRVRCSPPRIETVDCFGGMEAIIRYLIAHPDDECFYCVHDIAANIRACGLVAGGNLLIVNSGGEVVHHDAGRTARPD